MAELGEVEVVIFELNVGSQRLSVDRWGGDVEFDSGGWIVVGGWGVGRVGGEIGVVEVGFSGTGVGGGIRNVTRTL